MATHVVFRDEQEAPLREVPADAEPVAPPSVLAMLRTIVAPKSLLGALTKEQRRRLVRRAAEADEVSGLVK